MALLNNIYVFVETEDIDESVEVVTHPTESGFPTADSIRQQPSTISIKGYAVDTETMTAKEAIEKIRKLHKSGSLIDYVGASGVYSNYQIESFPKSYSNRGTTFDLTLKEIKVANKVTSSNTKPIEVKKSTPEVGDIVLFLGGYVYYSSDAVKHSAKREKGECRLTKISTLHNRKHIYHLISVDRETNKVYGWVDADRVQCLTQTTKASSNGGKQQTSSNEKPKTYKVKKGDTVWGIVNNIYPSWHFSVDNIIKNNPEAFSTRGDPTTLQIGAVLILC